MASSVQHNDSNKNETQSFKISISEVKENEQKPAAPEVKPNTNSTKSTVKESSQAEI